LEYDPLKQIIIIKIVTDLNVNI